MLDYTPVPAVAQDGATKLEAALSWAARGFRVFPLQENSKNPTSMSWTQAATADPATIRMWWAEMPNANIGFLTTGWVVPDVDIKDGKQGLETFMLLDMTFDTLTMRTPTGGYHLVYRGLDRLVGGAPLAKDIDVRSHNGYVVAPGSTIDGVEYVVEHDLPVAEFPEHLRHLLKTPRQRKEAVPSGIELDTPENVEIAAHWLANDAPIAVQGANGDDTAYGVACKIRDFGVSEGVAVDLFFDEYSPRCVPPWSLEEARGKVENAYRYAKGEAGSASLAAMFGLIDLPAFPAPIKGRAAAHGEIGSATPGGFRRLSDFVAEYEPLDYSIGPVVRTGSLYTITAATGAGKTGWMVMAALAIAMGRGEWIGCPGEVEQGRVVYLCFENPDDIRMRFMIACDRLGINFEAIGDRLIIRDQRAKPELIGDAMVQLAGAVVRDLPDASTMLTGLSDASGFKAIFVDTLAAFFDGDDSNSPVLGGEFMRRLRRYALLPGKPSVIVAAHPVKNAGEDKLIPYGSGAFLNEVDGNLTLWRVPNSQTVRLHWQGKLRGPEFDPMLFTVEVSTSPKILDRKGRPMRLPILMPATPAELMSKPSGHDLSKLILREARNNPGLKKTELRNSMRANKATVIAVGNQSARTFSRKIDKLCNDGLLVKDGLKLTLTSKGVEALDSKDATKSDTRQSDTTPS